MTEELSDKKLKKLKDVSERRGVVRLGASRARARRR